MAVFYQKSISRRGVDSYIALARRQSEPGHQFVDEELAKKGADKKSRAC
jgi:hypothetical protein